MKKLLFVICCLSLGQLFAINKDNLKESIVRVNVSFQSPNHYEPWRWGSPRNKQGQGIVVGKDLVLTLASTVSKAKLIQVRFDTEPMPISVLPVFIDYDRDIALLRGNLPKGIQPVVFPKESTYKIGSKLTFFWKTPSGRFLEGTAEMDRAEAFSVPPSYQSHLRYVATKSSIPGGRGGFGEPVFLGSKLIGIAGPGDGGADFYVIPNETLHRSIDFKTNQPAPETAMAGFSTLPCTQPFLREKLGLSDSNNGCLVSQVYQQGSGSSSLKNGDILLKLNGHDLDAWGRYRHTLFGPLPWSQLLSEKRLDSHFKAHIIRDGKPMDIKIDLSVIDEDQWLIARQRKGEPSRYFCRGGFIFQPLSAGYLRAWGAQWRNQAPEHLLKMYTDHAFTVKTDHLKDLVVFNKVLSHPINRGLQHLGGQIITHVDGEKCKSLKHLYQVFEDTSKDSIHLTLFPGNIPILLSKKELKAADQDIKMNYGIMNLDYLE